MQVSRRIAQRLLSRASSANLLIRLLVRADLAYTDAPKLLTDLASLSSIVVIAPHQDDEAIGCGGLLATVRQQQPSSIINIVYITDGAASAARATSQMRRSEAHQFAQRLRLASDQIHFLDLPDRAFAVTPRAVALLKALLDDLRPTHLLLPYPLDVHRDHFLAAQLVAEACRERTEIQQYWFYEVWTPLIPNLIVDISRVIEVKDELIGVFSSQTKSVDYIRGARGLAQYRAMQPGSLGEYAEAFYACSREHLVSIVQKTRTFGSASR